MTAQGTYTVFQWLIANHRKLKSVVASAALYIGGIEAAHPDLSFWEVLTKGGVVSVLTIGAGVLSALAAGWKTSSEPTGKQQAKAARKAEEFDAAVAESVQRQGLGGGEPQ